VSSPTRLIILRKFALRRFYKHFKRGEKKAEESSIGSNSSDENDTISLTSRSMDNSDQGYLSILHINAQSMRNKIVELEVEAELHDIIAISATWLELG
jgi:hypothetical protein